LNKPFLTVDEGRSSSWESMRGTNNSSPQDTIWLRNFTLLHGFSSAPLTQNITDLHWHRTATLAPLLIWLVRFPLCCSVDTETGLRDLWHGFDSLQVQFRDFFLFTTASRPALGTGVSFHGGKGTGAWSWPLTAIWCRG